MKLDFGCFRIKRAWNSRSQETLKRLKIKFFFLKSMGPGNQNFVVLSMVVDNNKYMKALRFTSVGLKVHGTNKLKFVMLYCGYH